MSHDVRGRAIAGALALLVFACPAAADVVQLSTLHVFDGTDGDAPAAGLVQGPDGRFYGTTFRGGASNLGTIFRIAADGTFSVLHSFAGGAEGAFPKARLALGSDGNLYGTTQQTPGTAGQGTIFRITPSGVLTTLHTFQYANSLSSAEAGPLMQASSGAFYGATEGGPSGSAGAAYRMDAAGSVTVLHIFQRDETDGGGPNGLLAEGVDGRLYGTTNAGTTGGAQSFGTVYRVAPDGGFATIDNFEGDLFSIGRFPVAGLVRASDGNFYGSTQSGGIADDGTLFRMTPSGVRTTLHSFTGADGGQIESELIQATDGLLYGTSTWLGTNYGGTVYRMALDGTFAVLHRFPEEASHANGLVQGADGAFYGTTQSVGGKGSVFRLKIVPGAPVVSFDAASQAAPTGNRKGESTTLVRVTLSAESTQPVEVPFTVVNDSPQMRYTVNPARLVIPAGDQTAFFVVRTAFNGPRAFGAPVDCNATLVLSFDSPIVNGTAGAITSSTVSVHDDAGADRLSCR